MQYCICCGCGGASERCPSMFIMHWNIDKQSLVRLHENRRNWRTLREQEEKEHCHLHCHYTCCVHHSTVQISRKCLFRVLVPEQLQQVRGLPHNNHLTLIDLKQYSKFAYFPFQKNNLLQDDCFRIVNSSKTFIFAFIFLTLC